MEPYQVAIAFISGAVSFFSPCRFALIPSYISYYLCDGERSSRPTVAQALLGGGIASLGIFASVLVTGSLIVRLWEFVQPHLMGLLSLGSLFIVLMGVLIILGVPLELNLPLAASRRKGCAGLFSFGVFYGLAIAGCAAPAFFLLIAYALTLGSADGMALFAIYALGMSALLMLTTLALSLGWEVVKDLNEVLPMFRKVAGLTLVAFGAYFFLNYAQRGVVTGF